MQLFDYLQFIRVTYAQFCSNTRSKILLNDEISNCNINGNSNNDGDCSNVVRFSADGDRLASTEKKSTTKSASTTTWSINKLCQICHLKDIKKPKFICKCHRSSSMLLPEHTMNAFAVNGQVPLLQPNIDIEQREHLNSGLSEASSSVEWLQQQLETCFFLCYYLFICYQMRAESPKSKYFLL